MALNRGFGVASFQLWLEWMTVSSGFCNTRDEAGLVSGTDEAVLIIGQDGNYDKCMRTAEDSRRQPMFNGNV